MSAKSLTSELKSLRNTKNQLEEDIQNLESLIFGSPNEKLMLIPGRKIPLKKLSKKQRFYYERKKTEIAPNFNLQEFNSNVLITPIVVCDFCPNTESILVNTIAFVNKKQNPEHYDLFFNYTLSDGGEPQLSIYICYEATEMPAKRYIITPFSIRFNSNSVDNGSGVKVPLIRIKAVKVFLVNRDPRTSRGTMTTVQHQNDTEA